MITADMLELSSIHKNSMFRHLIDCYKIDDLDLMSVELNSENEYDPKRKNAKYCVKLKWTPFPANESNKDLLYASAWFSSCLSAYACFNTVLKEPTTEGAKIYYAAGEEFLIKWVHDLVAANRFRLYHDSKNVNTSQQREILKRVLHKQTVYRMNLDTGVPSRTAGAFVKRARKFFGLTKE
jgi:hypothetical protein